MRMRHAFLVMLGLAWAGTGLTGCDDDDEVESAISCGDVCQTYQDCIDPDFDVAECTADCEDEVFGEDDAQARLDDCDDCLDARSCTEGTFECADDCVGVIDVTQ